MLTSEINSKRVDLLTAIAIGSIACWFVVGFSVLDPTNINWISIADPVTHYLGWVYFRHGPWAFPPGLNADYGLELASSIVFSDSIPLLAIPFKLISSFLPGTFQYFGLWMLACFILQALFASKLIRLLTNNWVIVWLGAVLFVLSPPMIWRLHPFVGHMSLAGHFLILAAIYLALRPNRIRPACCWGLLLVVAILIHAYLFVMVASIWAADMVSRSRAREQSEALVLAEFVGLTSLCGVVAWLAGYFAVGHNISTDQYGLAGLNLLALFDPGFEKYGVWSPWMPDLPGGVGHESFMYLGSGLLLLALVALLTWIVCPQRIELKTQLGRWIPLWLCSIGLTMFALTHRIQIGDQAVVLFHFNEQPALFGALRASARLFWPVYYLLFFVLIRVVVQRLKPRVAVGVLSLVFGIQYMDVSTGVAVFRSHYADRIAHVYTQSLKDPFWKDAGQYYRELRLVPSVISDMWDPLSVYPIALYAGAYGMRTNAAYFARVTKSGMNQENSVVNQMLDGHPLNPSTLYILDDRSFERFNQLHASSQHLLKKIDGYNVVAPLWLSR